MSLWAKRFDVDGLVVSVDAAERVITVAHKPIEGYMPAMVMPFRVNSSQNLKGIQAGARIRFELRVESNRSFARKLQVLEVNDPLIQTPAEALHIGDAVPDFTLMDHMGRRLSFAALRGRVIAVNFIYTRCPLPDVCPRLSATFAALQKHLPADTSLVSITIDPRYDTPEVLREYAARWKAGPEWRFLTGTNEEVARVASKFGLVYWPEEGSMTHSLRTVVIGRDGRVAAIVEGSGYRVDQLGAVIAHVQENGS